MEVIETEKPLGTGASGKGPAVFGKGHGHWGHWKTESLQGIGEPLPHGGFTPAGLEVGGGGLHLPLPELGGRMEGEHLPGEGLGLIGQAGGDALAQTEALGGHGGDHEGQTGRHGREHLALHPSPEAKGGDAEAQAGEKGGEIAHIAMHGDAFAREGLDRWRRIGTHNMEMGDVHGIGGELAQGGEHSLDIPEHGVGVGGMAKASEKHHAMPLLEGARQGLTPNPGGEEEAARPGVEPLLGLALLLFREVEGSIHHIEDALLTGAHGGDSGGIHSGGIQGMLPLHAQVMEIVGVVEEAGEGGMGLDRLQPALGHLGPGDEDGFVVVAALSEQRLHRDHPGMHEHLHAETLKGRAVIGLPEQVVGGEVAHIPAEGEQVGEEMEDVEGAGIPIRGGEAGLHHEDAPHPSPVAFVPHGGAVVGVVLKLALPLAAEEQGVAILKALGAGEMVLAAGDAFVVDHPGEGLHEHAIAAIANGHGQVGVFVVGGGVAAVEAAEAMEELGAQQHAGPRHVIHIPAEAVGGIAGVAIPSVVPGAAITPHDATGLLEAAIGIEQHGAHKTGRREAFKGGDELAEPVGGNDGVVVEEAEQLSGSEACAAIAGMEIAQVFALLHQAQLVAATGLHQGDEMIDGAWGGGIVHHQDLQIGNGLGIAELLEQEAFEAAQGEIFLAVDGDHHTHPAGSGGALLQTSPEGPQAGNGFGGGRGLETTIRQGEGFQGLGRQKGTGTILEPGLIAAPEARQGLFGGEGFKPTLQFKGVLKKGEGIFSAKLASHGKTGQTRADLPPGQPNTIRIDVDVEGMG